MRKTIKARVITAAGVIAAAGVMSGAAGYALHGQPAAASVRQLPAWVHWRQAPGFMRDVKDCGGGPAVIVWGGKGDTSALVCRSGVAEAS